MNRLILTIILLHNVSELCGQNHNAEQNFSDTASSRSTEAPDDTLTVGEIDIYDPEDLENIEIIKGPKATEFGTNLGGTI